MSQTTEAACLLQSGSSYYRRLGLRTRSGVDLFAGVKPGGVSIYFGDAPIFHFDFDGRWQRAFVDGVHYLKGLDATARSIDREREDQSLVLKRKTLPYSHVVDLDASIRSKALELIDEIDSKRLEILPSPPKARAFTTEEFRDFLERVSLWDSSAWSAHQGRYLGTYGPIPFLPPDSSNALILQATLGHAAGLAFGRVRPAEAYVRSPIEFRDHARTVSKLIGRRLAQYSGIFLGGADVLRRPVHQILEYLDAIEGNFIVETRENDGWDGFTPRLNNVHAFLDDFRTPLPGLDGWRSLQTAHLARVTLGVESGEPAIRASFGKTWQDDEIRAVVANLKMARIGVGLVVLIGAGGRGTYETHLRSTSDLLGSLPLASGDIVSLVDVRSLDESPIEGEEPLTDDETTAQIAAFKSRSALVWPTKGPKLVAYNPAKRWA